LIYCQTCKPNHETHSHFKRYATGDKGKVVMVIRGVGTGK
jgi:hypothetical protein